MKNKTQGFVKFMCKLEGKEPTHEKKWSEDELEKVRGVSLPHITKALEGNVAALFHSFIWITTPQGHEHWWFRNSSLQRLSEEDLNFLQELYESRCYET